MTRRRPKDAILLKVTRHEQPDDVTCGAACLAQVYGYHGLDKPIDAIVSETPHNRDGGTFIPFLGVGALKNGFGATAYPFGARVFDPTWRRLPTNELEAKLRARRDAVTSGKIRLSIDSYLSFFELGGKVVFRDLSKELVIRHLRHGRPVITGLSATYLYRQPRELDDQSDDVRGFPVGHFVVVSGYDPVTDRFALRDPARDIPFSRTGRYSVPAERLVSAVLLGDVTFDAVLLVVVPPRGRRRQ